MEDVDLVRRLKRAGRWFSAHSTVISSARRWERDGWFTRSAQNVSLATRFLLGEPPARLAQRYFRRKRGAVVLMARAPWTGGKTRLAAGIDTERHAELRRALFLDTLDAVTSTPNAEHIVACEPADACEALRHLVGPTTDVIAQRGGDLGARMANVFEDVFRLGIESVVVVGSDLPDLPARILTGALAALRGGRDRLVLGPAADGGYYLIGMNRPHPRLFDGIAWSTGDVLTQSLEAAAQEGLDVVLLDRWCDVDDAEGLDQLLRRAPGAGAARTREWSAVWRRPHSYVSAGRQQVSRTRRS